MESDVTVRVLLSRVTDVAIGSRSTRPLSEVTLVHAAALSLSSSSSPPSARSLGVDAFPLTNLFVACLGERLLCLPE